jgi:glycosyltransferase involved in cell wall biosynthesis
MVTRLHPDVPVYDLGYSEGVHVLRPLKFAGFLRKNRPDILHAHAWGMGSYDAVLGARLAGVPVVINGEHGSLFTKPYQIVLQRILAVLCDLTLSVSESLKKKIVEQLGIPDERITVIRNGVDVERFSGLADTSVLRKELSESYGMVISPEDFIVLMVGSLKREKNQIMALQALAAMNASAPGHKLKFVFVGTGPQDGLLRAYAEREKLGSQVCFLGVRDDVDRIMGIGNVLVLASLPGFEGLPNVVLEAMASGLPVISTAAIGISEIITHGENGWILERCDCGELARVLLALSRDTAVVKEAGNKARIFIRDSFSIAAMVSEYERVYNACYERKEMN